ncbi:MAG: hypothetical protein ABSG31_17660 [Tepidisphaeraceae bacterium]
MDEIIELLIRGLIALFSGGGGQKVTPPPVQKAQPTAQELARRALMGQGNRPVQNRLKQPKRPAVRQSPPSLRKSSGTLPPPRPPLPTKPIAPVVPIAPVARPSPLITGTAIRQLIRTRPSTMRIIVVLSEVLQPPLALREPR